MRRPDPGRSPAPASPWIELDSRHFALDTNLSPRAGERVVRELEEYLAALSQVAFRGAKTDLPPIPAVAFASGIEVHDYLRSVYSGLFVQRLLGQPLIVAGGDARGFYDGVARHELVHYVASQAFRRPLPRWLDEGIASYLETVVYDPARGTLIVGRATLSQVNTLEKLGRLPVSQVLAGQVDDRSEPMVDRFYATSWLLVHCLVNRHGPALDTYQALIAAGRPAEEAWASALPPSVREGLDAELAAYLKQRQYEVTRTVTWHAPVTEVAVRPLARADLLAMQALVHLAAGIGHQPPVGWRDRAEALAKQALAVDPANERARAIRRFLSGQEGDEGFK